MADVESRLAVNAPEEEQTNLVAALRDKILHTVQAARNPATMPQRAEAKLRNVNMFLNGLVSCSLRELDIELMSMSGPRCVDDRFLMRRRSMEKNEKEASGVLSAHVAHKIWFTSMKWHLVEVISTISNCIPLRRPRCTA